MFVSTKTPETTVKFDLSGKSPQLGNLPEDLFDTDEAQALGTFAALCCSPNVNTGNCDFLISSSGAPDGDYLVSIQTLALRNLALFAAGAQVHYHRNDFRDLEKLARGCANDSNHELVSWVLRAAYDRARSLGIVGPGTAETYRVDDARTAGFAYIEPEDGRGYGQLAEDLDEALFADAPPTRKLSAEESGLQRQFERWSPQVVADERSAWTRKRLFTYAAVMSACKPRLCTLNVEAVVVLALYGAGVRIELTPVQFKMLESRVKWYLLQMQADRFVNSRNRKMAAFALEAAQERARNAGISR